MSDDLGTGGAPKGRDSRPIKPLLKGLAIGIGTVVLLAAVIFVGSALSSARKTKIEQPALSAATQSQLAYEQGIDALAAGETTKAVALLSKAVKLDPTSTEAKSALTDARAKKASSSTGSGSGSKSGTGSGTGSESKGSNGTSGGGDATSTPDAPQVDDPVFSTEIDDLTKLLPSAVEGFSLGSSSVSERVAQRSGTSSGDPTVSRILWSVYDRKTPESAAKFVNDVSKELYAKDRAELIVDGAKAQFGTDGTLFASVVYVRGRYVFEVVLTSSNRTPSDARPTGEAAAAAFRDSL